ncbi:MAG: hypothetical protein J6575_03605 [Bifidobacterium sp.]|nr:hypothetical protein [Bifidobacterium sp.]
MSVEYGKGESGFDDPVRVDMDEICSRACSSLQSDLQIGYGLARRLVEEATKVDDSTSDGYHTFGELYRYRMIYHAWACRAWMAEGWKVVKSRRHHDGGKCFGGGWFIVSVQLPTGQVSNHYEALAGMVSVAQMCGKASDRICCGHENDCRFR